MAARRAHNSKVAGSNPALASILACALLLCACTTPTPRPVPLPVPARPVVPNVKASELHCLRDDVYTRIVDRERGYKTWGLALEAILEANNVKAAQVIGKP